MEPLSVEHESASASAYSVGSAESALTLRYEVGGEAKGMEVALASIFAKYTRELFVETLNRFFAARVGDRGEPLRRTAGYYQDGHRFLADLERRGALSAAERRLLVRAR